MQIVNFICAAFGCSRLLLRYIKPCLGSFFPDFFPIYICCSFYCGQLLFGCTWNTRWGATPFQAGYLADLLLHMTGEKVTAPLIGFSQCWMQFHAQIVTHKQNNTSEVWLSIKKVNYPKTTFHEHLNRVILRRSNRKSSSELSKSP